MSWFSKILQKTYQLLIRLNLSEINAHKVGHWDEQAWTIAALGHHHISNTKSNHSFCGTFF